MDDLMSLYIEDTKEYLAILNDSIIALEKHPDDGVAISEMFRAYHTMKSSTAAMEFKRTAGFIHRMEDLLHEVREGRIKISSTIIRLLYESYDHLEKFLHSVLEIGEEGYLQYEPLMEKVEGFINECINSPHTDHKILAGIKEQQRFILGEDDLAAARKEVSGGNQLYKITVEIMKDCAFKAVRAWMIYEDISKISKIICSYPAKPESEDFKNGAFSFDDTELRALVVSDVPLVDLLQELTISLNEIESIVVEEIKPDFKPGTEFDRLAAIPEQIKYYTRNHNENVSDIVDDIIGEANTHVIESYPDLKFGQIAVKENKADVNDIISALHVQDNVKSDLKNQSYIRIPANKVDNLVDHLGELLITQSLHKQEITGLLNKEGNKVLNNIMRMERIAKEIQDITMSLRMVSLKQTFQKIYRIGRDTAGELGKEVVIETYGDETEIDRNVVEKIHDPLMHLIRNAISHGIENEDERVDAGKSSTGHVVIQASNRRGSVYIEISDDGRGLPSEKIYRKALEKGLIDPDKKYGEDEILKFIYLPGFSTEEKVNSISGRGVGMNVVQTEIVKLGGKIDIVNRPGSGCSFILKIPVNLATINGTIVEISGSNYIIPTLNIKQILKPQEDQWVSIKGIRSNIVIRNEIIRIIPIGNILQTGSNEQDLNSNIVIVVEHEQKLMALPVKTILGKQEVVVKPLGSDFNNLYIVSGATILGDGRVSLILDIEALFKMTEEPVKAS